MDSDRLFHQFPTASEMRSRSGANRDAQGALFEADDEPDEDDLTGLENTVEPGPWDQNLPLDVNAVRRRRVPRRLARRIAGKATGRAIGRIFR